MVLKSTYIFLLLIVSVSLYGQEEEPDLTDLLEGYEKYIENDKETRKNNIKRHREIGLNLTQLVTQFIPFNEDVDFDGPFSLAFRTGKNKSYFSLQVGLQTDPSFNSQTPNFVNIAFGYLRKSKAYKKFCYYTSYNLLVSSGSFNIGTDQNNENGAIGGTFGFGFEYSLNEFISVGTESHLFIGSRDGDFNATIIPPIGLFLVGKLKK